MVMSAEDAIVGVVLTAIGILTICAVVVLKIWFGVMQCDARGQGFEDNKYGLMSGCMVKHEGRWLPLENIRGFD